MIIRFLKKHPTSFHWSNRIGQIGKYNPGATIKAMNLIMHGYAELIHSCKNCNPYHLNIDLKDFKKPFKYKDLKPSEGMFGQKTRIKCFNKKIVEDKNG